MFDAAKIRKKTPYFQIFFKLFCIFGEKKLIFMVFWQKMRTFAGYYVKM